MIKKTTMRTQFILSLVAIAGFVFAAQAAPPSKPNILFILVDDQRHDSLGCAGHPILKTQEMAATDSPCSLIHFHDSMSTKHGHNMLKSEQRVSAIGRIRQQIDREIFDYQRLLQCLSAYAKPRDRIKRLLDAGDIVRVKKGLYVFGDVYRRTPVSRELLANLIYGPSYISLDYALAWHGLIPERVTTVTSVTTGRSRRFTSPFGIFSYRSLPEPRYATGALLQQGDNESFLLASPEKALADKVWDDKRFSGASMAAYADYLAHDLRIDIDHLPLLDGERLEAVREAYSSRKIDRLIRYVQKLRVAADA